MPRAEGKPSLDRLREDSAVVRIHVHQVVNGSVREFEHPVHLVRAEDGTWQVFDY